jgi:hypothetical protein
MEIILTENQHTGLQEKIMNSIDSMGLLDTSKIFGGYDKLRKIMMGTQYLTKDVMIGVINDLFEDISEEGFFYLTVLDLDLNPIVIKDENGELCQIETIYKEGVQVYCYGGYKYETELEDFLIKYENLDEIHLYEIIDSVMDYYSNQMDV